MSNLIKKIQNHAFRHELWEKGDKILVAVSGGPDSVFLLNFFAEIAPKYDLSIQVVHVNYGLRGEDSDEDEKSVRMLAKKYDFPVSVLKAKKSKEVSEAHLRSIRYNFFEKTRKELKFDVVAVAHNMNDQAETVLMKIIRGAGLQGLAAMQPKRDCIIRPLLGVSREEIESYLSAKELSYRLDESNLDKKYLRNKVRHDLIPYLERAFNRSIKEGLASLADSVSAEYAYILDEAAQKFVYGKKNGGQIVFNIKDFFDLPNGLKKAALRMVVGHLKSNLIDVESANIEELEKVIKSNKNKSQEVRFCGLKMKRNGDKITLTLIG